MVRLNFGASHMERSPAVGSPCRQVHGAGNRRVGGPAGRGQFHQPGRSPWCCRETPRSDHYGVTEHFNEVFGDATPVVSYKGHLGNSGAASGLVELAASVLALQTGELPGTINCDKVAADCPVNVQVGAAAGDEAVRGEGDVHEPGAVAVAVVRRSDRSQRSAISRKPHGGRSGLPAAWHLTAG